MDYTRLLRQTRRHIEKALHPKVGQNPVYFFVRNCEANAIQMVILTMVRSWWIESNEAFENQALEPKTLFSLFTPPSSFTTNPISNHGEYLVK